MKLRSELCTVLLKYNGAPTMCHFSAHILRLSCDISRVIYSIFYLLEAYSGSIPACVSKSMKLFSVTNALG